MTRCDRCIHFQPFFNDRTTGRCGMTLPPFVQVLRTTVTTYDDGCDLGTPKEEA